MSSSSSVPVSRPTVVPRTEIPHMTQEIMAILFEKKEIMGDGDYIHCCDLLKKIHDQGRDRESERVRITIRNNNDPQSFVSMGRELRLRNQLLEEQEKFIQFTQGIMQVLNTAVSRRRTRVDIQSIMNIVRDFTDNDDSDTDTESDDESVTDDEDTSTNNNLSSSIEAETDTEAT